MLASGTVTSFCWGKNFQFIVALVLATNLNSMLKILLNKKGRDLIRILLSGTGTIDLIWQMRIANWGQQQPSQRLPEGLSLHSPSTIICQSK